MSFDRGHVVASAAAAFLAWALLLHWAPGFRWIVYAFITGSIACAIALFAVLLTTSQSPAANVTNSQYGPVAPSFTFRKTWEEEKITLKGREEYRRPAIFPESVRLSKAVDDLLDRVLRDFITSWYGNITRRPLLQHEVDRCIRSILLSVTSRITELDLVELGVANALPLFTNHLRDFYDAEHLVRGRDLSNNVTESEELSMAIAGRYKNGKLHSVASLSHLETAAPIKTYLRNLVQRVLPHLLPSAMNSSRAVFILLQEIIVGAVLAPTATMLIDPDTWNLMIVNFGGAALQDRKTVRKVRAALDQHAPASPKAARNTQFLRLRPYDNERQFERFIRAIGQVTSLNDARRFRSEIMSQLRRDSAVEGQDAAYLRRLETGRRLLEQRIAIISDSNAKAIAAKPAPSQSGRTTDATARKRQASLREVIYDAAGLSYFMEYMDRLNLMKLVQFYLVVDGFRNPLEGDDDETPPSVATDPERMDIGQIYYEYLKQPELAIPESALRPVKQYLKASSAASSAASTGAYLAARRQVLKSQTAVYNVMKDTHYSAFKRSDLYYKWLAIDDKPDASSNPHPRMSTDSSSVRQEIEPPAANPLRNLLAPSSDLRRVALSNTDLKELSSSKASTNEGQRRSLDVPGPRQALFDDDDIEDERMISSVPNLQAYDSDAESRQQAREEAKAVNAMQLALDNIVGDQDEHNFLSAEDDAQLLPALPRPNRPLDEKSKPMSVTRTTSERVRPSISSLGLVNISSHGDVFDDRAAQTRTAYRADVDRYASDGQDDSENEKIQEAAPGDLGLTEAIDVLNADIERLSAQRNVLDSLTAKAELTNNSAELRILRKSEQSLQREIKRKEMQKQQYLVQESDNSLYGRASVRIKSVMVGKEDDGHEFALYVIEVQRQAGDQIPAVTWAVTRRYSQFHELHKRLKILFPAVKELDFPRRQALFTLQKDFINKRRVTLEQYVQSLLLVPAICRSRELRAFLSQSAISSNGTAGTQVDARDFVSRIYNSVSDGMEEFLGNIPVLDQLSVAGQNLITAAAAQIVGPQVESFDPAAQDPATTLEAEAELNAYEVKESEPFVKPICDLFLEVFELSKGNNWLRGRTAVIVLHQLLGGTIERRVRESAKSTLQDEVLARYVERLSESVWPDGNLRQPPAPRTSTQKAQTRKEAGLLLEALIIDLVGSVVGKSNAKAAGRKIVAVINNPRLNTHLIFTLVDEIVRTIFPEACA